MCAELGSCLNQQLKPAIVIASEGSINPRLSIYLGTYHGRYWWEKTAGAVFI